MSKVYESKLAERRKETILMTCRSVMVVGCEYLHLVPVMRIQVK